MSKAFQEWLDGLTDGDIWAQYAIENVKDILGDLPENRKGRDKNVVRLKGLVDQIPPGMRAREEERQPREP